MGRAGHLSGSAICPFDVGNCASNKMNAYAVTSNDTRCQAVTAAIICELAAILSHSRPSPAVAGFNSCTSQPLARILAQEEAAFSAASFALASALAAVRAARSQCHA